MGNSVSIHFRGDIIKVINRLSVRWGICKSETIRKLVIDHIEERYPIDKN